ncbi:MAG: hypothetical protein HYZ57_16010 [Acidobacteria bacterium]|nr:hypothetical protein [Acidobacteriota bacterium]
MDDKERAALIDKIIENATKQAEVAKPTTADLIRLLQLRRELDGEQPLTEIEVRWVDWSEMDDAFVE